MSPKEEALEALATAIGVAKKGGAHSVVDIEALLRRAITCVEMIEADNLDAIRLFMSKVIPEPMSGCWLWEGKLSRGYGLFSRRAVEHRAHRFSYLVDHLCRVRSCVNPRHLEAVTQRENMLRGVGPAAKHAAKVTCPRGHAYDIRLARGGRWCQRCRTVNNRENYERLREKIGKPATQRAVKPAASAG